MPYPQAYAPIYGHTHQLLARYGRSPWEHIDYCETTADKNYLLTEYRLAYKGTGTELRSIALPTKYHEQQKRPAARRKRKARTNA